MIWDFIRDFFVQYIFGGITSNNVQYGGYIGSLYTIDDGGWESLTSDTDVFYLEGYSGKIGISIGDWLSTTATIVCMCLIVFLLICLVRWIFRVVSSAFLLK